MLRLAPYLTAGLVAGPIAVGLLGVTLPAFGLLPGLGGDMATLAPWFRLLDQPGLGRSVAVALAAGLGSTLIAVLLVFLFLAAADGTRLLGWMRRLVAPLLAVPHAAAAVGVAFLIAPSGLLARLASPWATGWQRPPDLLIVHDGWGLAMIAGLVAKEVPFLLLMCLAVLPSLDPARRLAIARSLGQPPVTAWLKAVAPGLYPLVRLPVFAVLAFACSTADVALILGPTNPPPLAVAVLRWFADPDLSMRLVASAGALLQLLVSLAAMAAWWVGERVVAGLGRGWLTGGAPGVAGRAVSWLGLAGLPAVTMSLTVAILGLAVSSLAGPWRFPDALPDGLTLAVWERSLPAIAGGLATTLLLAALAAALATVAVLAVLEQAARRGRAADRALRGLLYLPLLLPQVPFVFGLVVGAETVGLAPGHGLVLVGHVVFVLPYVLLVLAEPYRRFDPRWIMLGATLGASPARTFWTVRLPILLGPCLAALAVGLAVSVGQYLPTLLLGAGRVETVTTAAVALASGGDRRVVGSWALAQAAVPAAGFALALLLPRLAWRRRRGLGAAR
ncbi:ABC transporter permease subunit [Thalassobaculum sp.]|uniref:ABC transporter permease n=1 Tax=Thalassobaculum sp. TaxID=2022740 RepID=UPI0032F050E5